MKSFFIFIAAILISFIPGAIGVLFSPVVGHTNEWFNSLTQSSLTPAPMVFSIAWTILYLLLGIALYCVWRAKRTQKHRKWIGIAEWLFFVQMVLNALWSYVFFGLHMPMLAVFTLAALILVTLWMTREFGKVSRAAYYLVWPYIAWLLFAFYLNSVIAYLN